LINTIIVGYGIGNPRSDQK